MGPSAFFLQYANHKFIVCVLSINAIRKIEVRWIMYQSSHIVWRGQNLSQSRQNFKVGNIKFQNFSKNNPREPCKIYMHQVSIKVRTMWDEVKICQNKFSKSKIEIKYLKFQNFGPNYTSNRRDTHCQFHQHQRMVKFSELGENYRALRHQSRKWGATTNFGQKCTIDNSESDKHSKLNQNWTTVKFSKLGEQNCEPALEPNIVDFKVP